MKVILQRVHSASVTVDHQIVSKIGKGVLIFAAVGQHDTQKEVENMAAKVLKVKMWEDDDGAKWKKNVQEIGGEVLCVSQFTLLASLKKGNKPDFHKSAHPVVARELYDCFLAKVQALYHSDKVQKGVFQALMEVRLVNDGPVTFEIEIESPTSNTMAEKNAVLG